MKQYNQDMPNVILLILDSVRADVLSIYDGKVKTPGLSLLADRGTTFERAYSVGNNTSVAHGALFSGRYPSETKIVNASHRYGNLSGPILPLWLQDAGYRTFGAVAGGKLSQSFGFDRGFDEFFEARSDIPDYLSKDYLLDIIFDDEMRWPLIKHFYRTFLWGIDHTTGIQFDLLERKLTEQGPIFGFSNFLTAHTPYDPPRPYKERATPELVRPKWFFIEYLTGVEERTGRSDVRDSRVYGAQTTEGVAKYFSNSDWLTQDEIGLLFDWYCASIRYLDSRLHSFLDFLKDEGILDDTIIIVTSDHGEHFGEHGLLRHDYSWFNECIQVPLVISGPDVPAGQRRSDYVSLVDLFDTICDLVEIDMPNRTSGDSLFPGPVRDYAIAEQGIRNVGGVYADHLSPEQQEEFNLGWKAIRTEDYLLKLTSQGGRNVYDRPNERELKDINSVVFDCLQTKLLDVIQKEFIIGYGQEPGIDKRLRRQLRYLGYSE